MDNRVNFGNNTVDIPIIFKTFISEELFQNCISCGKYLLNEDSEYFIEKVVKDNFVEYEYAVCSDCANTMRKKMSKDSIMKISNYFNSNTLFLNRMHQLSTSDNKDIINHISNCMVKGSEIKDLNEYQLAAHCKGKKIIVSYMPYMIGFEAINEISELLSQKTKKEMDDFMDQNFKIPLEWEEIFKTRKPVFF